MINKILGKGKSDTYSPDLPTRSDNYPNTQQFIYNIKGEAGKFNDLFLSHRATDVANVSLRNDEAGNTDEIRKCEDYMLTILPMYTLILCQIKVFLS